MTTEGAAAFDAATSKRLEELRKRPVDCFGEPIKLQQKPGRLVETMARGPQRAALLAVRQHCGRHAVDAPLEAMVASGQARCDDEGFYTLNEAAFGP